MCISLTTFYVHVARCSRARKVRCDGAKPICCNCQKRPSEAEQCTYDSGPHRKGREKGTARARTTGQVATAKKPAKRKRSPQGDDGDRSHSATDVDVPVNEMPSGSVPAVSPVVSDDMGLESELLDFADVCPPPRRLVWLTNVTARLAGNGMGIRSSLARCRGVNIHGSTRRCVNYGNLTTTGNSGRE